MKENYTYHVVLHREMRPWSKKKIWKKRKWVMEEEEEKEKRLNGGETFKGVKIKDLHSHSLVAFIYLKGLITSTTKLSCCSTFYRSFGLWIWPFNFILFYLSWGLYLLPFFYHVFLFFWSAQIPSLPPLFGSGKPFVVCHCNGPLSWLLPSQLNPTLPFFLG